MGRCCVETDYEELLGGCEAPGVQSQRQGCRFHPTATGSDPRGLMSQFQSDSALQEGRACSASKMPHCLYSMDRYRCTHRCDHTGAHTGVIIQVHTQV